MALQQRWIADRDALNVASPEMAEAAGRYQRHREIETRQLAVMASHNLVESWTPEAHAAVLEARVHVRAAREARATFRKQIRDFVTVLRGEREPLSSVLRHARSVIQSLQSSGAIHDDGGWLEAEVLEWAIEEFEG
jgi:hypothetical protein